MQKHPFGVLRDGQPIKEMGVVGAIDPHISYNQSFAEWDAATSCGLDLWKWESRGYPGAFMAKVIAFHNLKQAIELHVEDAKARIMRKKSKSR